MNEPIYVEYVDEWGDEVWKLEYRRKFESGMTGILEFQAVDVLSDGTRCYNVNLDLRKKRKRNSIERSVTGQDGLEPASWVLECMSAFESQQVVEWEWPFRIEVMAVDNRRWKLYERILTRRGYRATMVEGQRTLVKRIER